MIIQTEEVVARQKQRAANQKYVDDKVANEGLTLEEYNQIKEKMVATDIDIKEYLRIRYSLGEIVWTDDDRLVCAKRTYTYQ